MKHSAWVLAIALLPVAAVAAGLGKLTVLSPLGKPLRAELDVSASSDELGSLTARVASVEAFRQANIDYVSVLSGLRFTLEKRANGQSYFKISSDRAINDPFLDFLVELNWSSGRVVREYTFLLDPPDLKPQEESAGPSLAETAPVAVPAPAESSVAGGNVRPPSGSVTGSTSAASPASAPTRVVHSGDTLGRIASELRPEGVSLDQMLVALFRGNPDAFDGSNMNRLRAGKILSIPEAGAATAIGGPEARKIILAQSADFAAYRRQLAASATTFRQLPAAEQESKGRITPKVEEKAAKATGSDQLRVSRTASTTGTGGATRNEENQVAREKALKEANSRIAELEKNLSDLKRLAELKRQAGTEQQQPSQQKVETAAASMPATSVQDATKPAEKPADKSAPKPAVKVESPPAPGFVESNLPYLLGAGGLFALIAGFFGFKTWKRKGGEGAWGPSSKFSNDALSGSSVFSVSAGQRLDTSVEGEGALEPGLDAAAIQNVEKVDPLQEAEVYLAYGRDAQAEEILLEALKSNPGRLEIHRKLLEIYAARHSIPQFVTLAEDLHRQTGGTGSDWEHAVSLGRGIDPSNPLFGGAASPTGGTDEAGSVPAAVEPATDSMQASPASDAQEQAEVSATLDFDLDLSQAAPQPPIPQEEAAQAASAEAPTSLDFDLDLGAPPADAHEAAPVAGANASGLDFDLDLGAPAVAPEPESVAAPVPVADEPGLDIDLDLPEPGMAATVESATSADSGNMLDFDLGEPAATPAPEAASVADQALDFDFDLGKLDASPQEAPIDLSSISLDLDQPLPGSEAGAADNPEASTKLELAQAYQEMGDKDGARELLEEVLKEGSPAQQEQARNKLGALG